MDYQLQIFKMVVEERNFSRAAHKLHMTQPAVSQHIKTLEERLQTVLFDRTNKAISLTKTGEIAYQYTLEILTLYEQMETTILDQTTNPSGIINIGSSYTFGEYKLPHVIAKVRKDYPLITPTISIKNTADICHLVANKSLDIGIIEGEPHEFNEILTINPFLKDEMSIIVSKDHPFTLMEGVYRDQLNEDTWLLREEGSGTREMAEMYIRENNINPKSILSFGSTNLIKEAIEAGLGIGFLSKTVIQKELKLGSLCIIDGENLPVTRYFSSVLRNSPFITKAVQVFRDELHSFK